MQLAASYSEGRACKRGRPSPQLVGAAQQAKTSPEKLFSKLTNLSQRAQLSARADAHSLRENFSNGRKRGHASSANPCLDSMHSRTFWKLDQSGGRLIARAPMTSPRSIERVVAPSTTTSRLPEAITKHEPICKAEKGRPVGGTEQEKKRLAQQIRSGCDRRAKPSKLMGEESSQSGFVSN
eukprot:2154627-Pleurochrysis_carterae.AAC.2